MGIFNNNKELEKKVEDLKLTKRLEKGRLDKEAASKDKEISKLESKVELVTQQLEDMQESRDYFQGLENDRDAIERQKKVLKIEKEDLEEDKKLYEHRKERFEKRATELEETENNEYKKGYSDGLADGLRKAHDITREDRKYLTMIAMSTNQSAAINTSMKALEGGFKDDSSDTKS